MRRRAAGRRSPRRPCDRRAAHWARSSLVPRGNQSHLVFGGRRRGLDTHWTRLDAHAARTHTAADAWPAATVFSPLTSTIPRPAAVPMAATPRAPAAVVVE